MHFKLRYLPLAEEDIDDLAAYLSSFYPNTAGRVLDEMQEKLQLLQDQPWMCEEYPAKPFYRKLVVSGYLVFYHVNEEGQTIDIYRILRGSWNLNTHLRKSK